MITSNIDSTCITELRQLVRADAREAGIKRLRPQRIEHLAPLTRAQKLRLRLGRMAKVKAVAYGLSAVVGLAAGQAVQNLERGVTAYDPVSHAQWLETRAQSIALRNADRQEYVVGAWLHAAYRSMKQAITNPQDLIEKTETYQSLLEKYYNMLKVVDKAAFVAPALLLFMMLGAYLERRINRIQDDVVETTEIERLRSKINELVDAANRLSRRSDAHEHP